MSYAWRNRNIIYYIPPCHTLQSIWFYFCSPNGLYYINILNIIIAHTLQLNFGWSNTPRIFLIGRHVTKSIIHHVYYFCKTAYFDVPPIRLPVNDFKQIRYQKKRTKLGVKEIIYWIDRSFPLLIKSYEISVVWNSRLEPKREVGFMHILANWREVVE